MDALVADKREPTPTDDMISHLVEAEVEREDGTVERLTDMEVARFIMLLAAAGAETVTKLVGNAVMTFAENPDELAKLKADPSLAGSAVEEVLRYKAPSQYQGRFSVADREFHGETIPAGFPVLIITGAANRDERAYDDPDRFDIERTGPARHRLRPRHPLLHRRPPGPPRGQDRVQRALPPLARTSRSTTPASSTSTWPTSPARRRCPSPSEPDLALSAIDASRQRLVGRRRTAGSASSMS